MKKRRGQPRKDVEKQPEPAPKKVFPTIKPKPDVLCACGKSVHPGSDQCSACSQRA